MFRTQISLQKFIFLSVFLTWSGLEIAFENTAQGLTFTKIADATTPVPDSTSSFIGFDFPAIQKGKVLFIGSQFDAVNGLFIGPSSGTTLQRLVDTTTSVPGGSGTFTPNQYNLTGFAPSNCEGPKLGKQYITFVGRDAANGTGVYTVPVLGGAVLKVANFKSLIPGGTVDGQTKFTQFCRASIDSTNIVAFDDITGVYAARFNGRNRRLIANSNTPATPPPFPVRQFSQPFVSGKNVVFVGGTVFGPFGIYTNTLSGGTPPGSNVVDGNTPAPGGGTIGVNITTPVLDGTNLAFQASSGIYYKSTATGVLQLVANTNTSVPGGSGTFTQWFPGSLSISGGGVVFLASSTSPGLGIYRWCRGSIKKIIAKGDTLDGRVVTYLELGNQAMSGREIAFVAGFGIGANQGVFVAKGSTCKAAG